MSSIALDPARERYVSLATYRRDGREVCTPVWMAGENGIYYVFTAPEVGKVRRIRANGRVKLAACNYRGVVAGPWLEARAQLVDDAATVARALRLLRAKYGWQMFLLDAMAKLSGRFTQRAYIEISL